MDKNIGDLRAYLFDALKGLSDKENPMDMERAKAIADVGQVIINSAKVEVDYIKATGGAASSEFLDMDMESEKPGLPGTVHRLRG